MINFTVPVTEDPAAASSEYVAEDPGDLLRLRPVSAGGLAVE